MYFGICDQGPKKLKSEGTHSFFPFPAKRTLFQTHQGHCSQTSGFVVWVFCPPQDSAIHRNRTSLATILHQRNCHQSPCGGSPSSKRWSSLSGEAASSCTICLPFEKTHTTNTRMPWQDYFQTLKPRNQRQAVVEDQSFAPQLHLGRDFFCPSPMWDRSIPPFFCCLPWQSAACQKHRRLSSSFSLMSFQGNICLATTVSVGILALTNQTASLCRKAFTTKTSSLGLNNMITNNP